MSAGALEVGAVTARLGATLHDDGFDRFERKIREAKGHSDRPINADLGAKTDTRGFDKYDHAVKGVNRSHDDLVRGTGRVRGAMGSLFVGGAGVAAGAIGFGALALGVKSTTAAFDESAAIGRQTEAVIKSTGGAAKVTAKDVDTLATSLSRKTGVDDEAIASAENMLLTFTNVRNEVGKGNDIFNRATTTANDMSVALGVDAKQSAMQLGKALNDPVKGITALTRVGVTFTAGQKEQIKNLSEHGHRLEAQKIILKELGKEFGGSAEAQATGSKKMAVALGNVQEAIGGLLAPAVTKVTGFITNLANGMMDGKGSGGEFLDTLKLVGRYLQTGFAVAVDAVTKGVNWVGKTIDENRPTINSLAKTVENVAGRVVTFVNRIGSSFSKTFGASSGTGRDVKVLVRNLLSFADTIAKVLKPIIDKTLAGIEQTFRGFFTVIRGVIRVISGILTGDFGKAWDGVKDIFNGALDVIVGTIKRFTAPFRVAFGGLWKGITNGASAAWGLARKLFNGGLDMIAGGVSTVLGLLGDVAKAGSNLPFVGGKFDGLAKTIKGAQRGIDKYRESLRDTNKEHDKTRGKADKAGDSMKGAGDKARKGARGIGTLGTSAAGSAKATADAATGIARNVGDLSKELGDKKPLAFRANLTGAVTKALTFATGGIPNPGSGAGDDHVLFDPQGRPVAAMSGTEGILNTPQMGVVDWALRATAQLGIQPFGGLDALWGSGMRHYAAGGQLVTASVFNDAQTASGKSTSGVGFAELSHNYGAGVGGDFAALGGLPMGTVITIARGGKSINAPKIDVGAGGPALPPATVRAIDLTPPAAAALGVDGLANVLWKGGTGAISSAAAGVASVVKATIDGPGGALRHLAQLGVDKMRAAGQSRVDSLAPTASIASMGTGAAIPPGMTGNLADAERMAQAMGLTITSTTGGNHVAGSYHYQGRAFDASNGSSPTPQMAAFYRAVLAKYGSHITELFYDPLGGIKFGKSIGAIGNHSDHVHVAFNRGGQLVRRYNGGGTLPGIGKVPSNAVYDPFGMTPSSAGGQDQVGSTTTVSGKGKHRKTETTFDVDPGHRIAHYAATEVRAYNADAKAIEQLGLDYAYSDRRFNLTDEVLIDPDTGAVNAKAVKARGEELRKLLNLRKAAKKKTDHALAVARKVAKSYATIVARMKRARAAISTRKGKGAKDRAAKRAKYTEGIKDYSERLSGWRAKIRTGREDSRNAGLDVAEARKELASVLGTTATPEGDTTGDTTDGAQTASDGADTGGSSSGDGGTADPGEAPASAESIAAQVSAALESFNSQRGDLYSAFGSNFTTAATNGAAAQAAAIGEGIRNYGAGGASAAFDAGSDVGGGGPATVNNVTNNFAAPPPDPHTWAKGQEFELNAS